MSKNLPSFRLRLARIAFIRKGWNEMSFRPSKSTGIRRFSPQVSKSNPASIGDVQAITAFPSPIPSRTSRQIISRVRRKYIPT